MLTIKRDKDGNFLKTKARWVLRGFQDRQKDSQQTDSPAASRPGFRLAVQTAANNWWDLIHIDAYDESRDLICQIPPEAGQPPWTAARMEKPAYGLNDAPRRWWNIVDKALRSYGLAPTRADRCTYVLYGNLKDKTKSRHIRNNGQTPNKDPHEAAIDYLLDPVSGNNAQGHEVLGVVRLHVDDLCLSGGQEFKKKVIESLKKDFAVGSEDTNDIMFVGQRLQWKHKDDPNKGYISVNQKLAVEAVEEVSFDKKSKNNVQVTPQQHTAYRSVLGQINWLQSRTQAHICYRFSRCASKAAKPTIGDVRELNKLVRVLKATEIELRFWPVKGPLRILGYPDASYRNNDDKSSQRAHVIFLAEQRNPNLKSKDLSALAESSKKKQFKESEISETSSRGSLVDYESQKITTTTMSTTVAELGALMKCFGTCLFLKGLWADLSGEIAPIDIRTDANNLVTTAGTTHLPEQQETHHLTQMLRKESNSGALDDLAHVSSKFCLADPLTKASALADELVRLFIYKDTDKADLNKGRTAEKFVEILGMSEPTAIAAACAITCASRDLSRILRHDAPREDDNSVMIHEVVERFHYGPVMAALAVKTSGTSRFRAYLRYKGETKGQWCKSQDLGKDARNLAELRLMAVGGWSDKNETNKRNSASSTQYPNKDPTGPISADQTKPSGRTLGSFLAPKTYKDPRLAQGSFRGKETCMCP